jgi:phage anti-repressor protein
MNFQNVDIVALMDNNPISKLDETYQSKLVEKIKQNFSEKEEQFFIGSMYCYLNFHKTKDFVIDLDNIWEWIGFSRKDPAKRILLKEFEEKNDYIIQNSFPLSCGKPKSKDLGGRPNEKILMNVETFKQLCLVSGTSKAKEIRKYYVKLENILLETVDEQSEGLVQKLKLNQRELELSKHELFKVTRKKVIGNPKGEYVYVLKMNKIDDDEYKIGKSKDLTNREKDLIHANSGGEMVYTRKCVNETITEKVIHQILDNYRMNTKREWFKLDINIIKKTVDTTICFLDDFQNYVKHFKTVDLYGEIQKSLTKCKKLSGEKIVIDIDNVDEPLIKKEIFNEYTSESSKTETKFSKNNKVDVEKISELKSVNKSLDFEKFIKKWCILDPNRNNPGYDISKSEYFSVKVKVEGMFKLWSKRTDSSLKEFVHKYFNKNHCPDKIYFKDIDTKVSVYRGFKLKEFKYKSNNSETPLDKFIKECCKVGPLCRGIKTDIKENYEKWMKKLDKKFILNSIEEDKLDYHLCKQFIPTVIYVGTSKNQIGYWGIDLINSSTPDNIGLSLSHSYKKRVLLVNMDTKQVDHNFSSLMAASDFFGVCSSSISNDIKYKRIRNKTGKDGSITKYLICKDSKEYYDGETKEINIPIQETRVKNKDNSVTIYKYDVSTKKIIKIFKSIQDAAEIEKIKESTFRNYLEHIKGPYLWTVNKEIPNWSKIPKLGFRKTILKKDKSGNILKEYKNISEAARKENIKDWKFRQNHMNKEVDGIIFVKS